MPYFGRRLKGRQAGDSSSNLGPWVLVLEGELRAIVTTRSQLLPNTNWRLNLNSFIVDNVLSHQGSFFMLNGSIFRTINVWYRVIIVTVWAFHVMQIARFKQVGTGMQ